MPQISREKLLSDYGIDLDKGLYKIYEKDGQYQIFSVKDDTEGCPLLGMQATEVSLIAGTSRPAVALVKGEVMRAMREGESVTIDIYNPTALT